MSRFFSARYAALEPYVPGEQPRNMERLIKLNTNELPFPPSPRAMEALRERTRPLNLYSDPEQKQLRQKLAERFDVRAENVLVSNGSDEALNLAFMAFADEKRPLYFPDITYGFYPVFAALNHIPYTELPLTEELAVDPADYMACPGTIVLANPNAPTGKILPVETIAALTEANPNRVVIVDEAYIDFGGDSCVPLTKQYDNLLVVQTFSKSRGLAGARLGFAIGAEALMADLETLRNSINPYNVNSATAAAGIGALEDEDYTRRCCRTVARTRQRVTEALRQMGFEVTDSMTNFVFARTPAMAGGELYARLKERGVLVRHFDKQRITDYLRITIGTEEQMDRALEIIKEIVS